MAYSPLTNEILPPTGKYWNGKAWVNKWSARPAGVRINGLNVHHHAATSDAGIARLVTSNDPASANYIIRNNGSLIGSVPEELRAWTTSAYANDDDKITVEIQNETGAPSWRISDAAMGTLIRLYADLAKRHGFAPVRANLKGHQEYGVATACPGPYLLPRLDDVALKAAALGTSTTVQEDFMAGLTDAQQQEMYARIMGFLVQRYDAEGNPARALDSLDGGEIARITRIYGDRIVGDVADLSGIDVTALAAALAAALPINIGVEVVEAGLRNVLSTTTFNPGA